jgi:spermidine/putrescine transport system ATP-binding protein
MDRGRIVQIGTPREIYTRPASVFVSDFIGQTNFLRGTVTSSEAGVTTLQTADGQSATGASESTLGVGIAATLSVRPEAIRLSRRIGLRPGEGLRGKISEIIYLGSSVRVGTSVADVLVWADLRDDEAAGLAPGDDVMLAWQRSAATVWAGAAQA